MQDCRVNGTTTMLKRNAALSVVFLSCFGILVIWHTGSHGDTGALLYHHRDFVPPKRLENVIHGSKIESTKVMLDNRPPALSKIKTLEGNSSESIVDATQAINQEELQTENEFFDIEGTQLERKKLLDEACNRLGMSRDLPPASWEKTVHFIASDKFKFIYCFVPKISCTTWKEVMSTLYQADPSPLQKVPRRIKGLPLKRKGRFLKMSDIRDANKVMQRWKTYAKFMFTREPLERALSAYLDKFVHGQQVWERQFGVAIIKRYRRQNASGLKFPLKEKIRFDEFIRFITDNGPNAKMTQQTDHWLPVSRITSPCRFKYDFIGHYETLKYDAPYVINKFNLSRYVTFPEVHSSRSHERMINAYKEIPRDLIYRLIDYYKDDYELFGYSANMTLDIIFSARTDREAK